MEKYSEWNKVKQNINKKDRCFYVKPREVAWIHLGENVGDEENGKGENFQRPVMLTHARLYDTKRVIGHVGYIKKEDFEKIKIAFKAMF